MSYRSELQSLVAPAERVLQDDLISLERMEPDRRKQHYDDIKSNEREFEDDFRDRYSDKLDNITIDDIRSQFVTARLFLHVASRRDDRSEPIAPDAFTDDEVQAAIVFDRYRAFDVSDEEDLQRRIENKDDEIYEFVVEEIATQTENIEDLMESQYNRIRTDIMDYLNYRYKERFERSREAVSLYIQYHGLPNVIQNIEDAVDVTAESAITRRDVEEAVNSQFENLSKVLHTTLREQERAIRSDIADVEGELASLELDEELDIDTGKLESQLGRIENELQAVRNDRQADIEAIDTAVAELSAQRDRIEAKINDLEATSSEVAEEAATDAAQSVADKAKRVVSDEAERLAERREELDAELARLNRERERLEIAGERLETEQESLQERVEQVTESLPDDTTDISEESDVVPARIARLYEVDFIARFDESMQEAQSITLPGGGRFEPGPDFAATANQSSDQREQMESLLAAQDRDTEPVDHYPLRRRSRYTISTKSLFSLSVDPDLVVEATVHSNLEAFAKNGFDARPAGLDNVLDIINRVTGRAEKHDTPHLIVVASTTGWTDRVRELVTEAEFSRTRLGSDVSLCLVDIRSGELLYDQSDELVHSNRGIFERAVRTERVDICEETIREEYLSDPMTDTIRLEKVVEETDHAEHIVSSAFDRIEAADDAIQEYHPKRGPYLITEAV